MGPACSVAECSTRRPTSGLPGPLCACPRTRALFFLFFQARGIVGERRRRSVGEEERRQKGSYCRAGNFRARAWASACSSASRGRKSLCMLAALARPSLGSFSSGTGPPTPPARRLGSLAAISLRYLSHRRRRRAPPPPPSRAPASSRERASPPISEPWRMRKGRAAELGGLSASHPANAGFPARRPSHARMHASHDSPIRLGLILLLQLIIFYFRFANLGVAEDAAASWPRGRSSHRAPAAALSSWQFHPFSERAPRQIDMLPDQRRRAAGGRG